MENTILETLETHQEVYEWWRNKREEIVKSINDVRASGTLDTEVLDLMESLTNNVKIRKKTMEEYFGGDD